MAELEHDWPETLMAARKLQDGWCGKRSQAFSPRQLLLASIFLSIGEVYGLNVELFLKPPALVQIVVSGLCPTKHGIELFKSSDDKPFMPHEWPDILHNWAETCIRLSAEEGEAE